MRRSRRPSSARVNRVRPRARAGVVPILLVVLASVGSAAPALAGPRAVADPAESADPPTTVTTKPVDRRIVDAGREVSEAEAERVDLARAIAEIDAAVTDLDARIAGVDADLGPARTARDDVLGRLQGRAVTVYQQRGTGLGAALSIAGPDRLAAGAHYADALAVVDAASLARLQAVVDDLEARRSGLVAERRDRTDERSRRAVELVEAQARSAVAAGRVAALGGTPVMGASPVSAGALAGWFRASGHGAVLSGGVTIEDLAALFVEEGEAVGVRADLAFAQSVVETGWFAHATDDNFAGIGACDSCDGREIAFPTPRAVVRAQMQLLRNYADADARASGLGHPPEVTLYGVDPVGAARTYDGFSAKGTAPVWDAMGGGRWATDPVYAGKVLAVAAGIRAFTPPSG